MRQVTIVGVGQIGQLLGRGALRAGMRVTPVRRGDGADVWSEVAPGSPVVVAVGEGDLEAAIESVPEALRSDAVLVQNELFPARWRALGLADPTVLVLWSNKKAGRVLEAGRRSAVYGRHAEAIAEIHAALELPCEVLADEAGLGRELVAKYAFILSINVLGLVENKTAGAWLVDSPDTVRGVVADATALGSALLGRPVDGGLVREAVLDGMGRLAQMPCRGRSAPARLARAGALAAEHGVELGHIEALELEV